MTHLDLQWQMHPVCNSFHTRLLMFLIEAHGFTFILSMGVTANFACHMGNLNLLSGLLDLSGAMHSKTAYCLALPRGCGSD